MIGAKNIDVKYVTLNTSIQNSEKIPLSFFIADQRDTMNNFNLIQFFIKDVYALQLILNYQFKAKIIIMRKL